MSTKHQAQNKRQPQAEEDDYMSAAFLTASAPIKAPETSIARSKRLKREAEARGQHFTKAEREAQQQEQQAAVLKKSLIENESGKGMAMMRKLGYKPGETIGKSGGLEKPISVEMREGREGIGREGEKKRKMREEYAKREEGMKKAKVGEEEYVMRMRGEREAARLEGQVKGAMKVAEGLDETAGTDGGLNEVVGKREPDMVWRPVQRESERTEQEQWDRRRGFEGLGSLPEYEDEDGTDEDEEGGGLGERARKLAKAMQNEEADEEDEDDFESLSPTKRLERVLKYMREKHRYCFWCKMQYEEQGLPGCPGLTEEEHD